MDASLVDRDRELDHLQAALDGAAAGQGSLTVLSGEAGIGKSALANAFASRARVSGFAVAWGRAWEAGGAPPLWPWTEVVRELVPVATGIDLQGVGELLPEIGAPRVAPTDVDQARFRLYDATARLLRRLAASPLAIVLEDLHAADQGTLELLHFLAPALARASIAIVATWRDPESQLTPSAALFARIGADAHTIPLARLSDAAVQALVARAGHGPEVVRRIVTITEGNPLVVVESLRLLRAAGTTTALPARVQDVMRHRLALLPAETRAVLELAAADGRTTDVGTVCIASGRARPDVLRALRSAVEAQVIDMSDPDHLSFTHVLLRDVLYDDLGEAQRLAAHAALVKALEERVSLDPRSRTVGLARHAVEAAPLVGIAKAVDYTRAAAERALELQAHEEAIALLEKALAILDLLGDDDSQRFALLLALGRAHMRAEDSTRGRLVCRDAAAIARRRGRVADLAQVALAYGEYLSFAMLDRELQALLEEALKAIGDSDEPLRSRLLARLAASLQPAPDPAGPISMAREAISLSRKSSDAHIRLEVLDAAGSAFAYFGDPDERLALDRELSEIASVLGDHVRLARSLVRIAFDCWERGDRPGADEATSAHARIALGQPSHARRVLLLGNIANVLEGRLDEARDTLARASAIDSDRRATRIATLSQRAAIAFASDDAVELGAVEPELSAVLYGLDAAYRLPLSSRFDAALGRDDALAAKLDEARRTPELWRGRPMGTGFAVGCARLGDTETAAALYETALPFARRNYTWGIGSMVVEGPMGEAVGLFARAMGREDEAVAHLEQALADAVRLGAVLHAARIRRHLGSEREAPMLERSGDIWRIRFAGAEAHVKDSRGLQILAHLVSRPGREIHVFDLLGVEGDTGDAGPALDREAIAAYRARVADLQSEIDQAEQWGETDKATRLQKELEAIARELGRGVGLGGRPRQEKAAVERARVNVRRRIVLALQQIEAVAPALAAHLSAAVRTGVTCVYDVKAAPLARG